MNLAVAIAAWLVAVDPAVEGVGTSKAEGLVSTVATVERIAMPKMRGPAEVSVDALRSQVIITAPRDLGAVAAKISSGLGDLCPRWGVEGGRIVLRCRTRQLHAAFAESAGKRYLDLYELRGLPRQAEEEKLYVFYDPARSGVGGTCPGTLPVVRGECALKEGDKEGARAEFKQAWATQYKTLAALRLGDLASEGGDLTEAALWWARAGSTGPFGRLARGRLCELTGECLAGPTSNIFDAGEIAEPMRTELALRGARIDLYAGRTGLALRWISDLLKRGAQSGGCVTVGRLFCRRLILAGLEEERGDGGREALLIYLSVPDRVTGPYAVEMARAASERAAALGAPVFAANVLASVAGYVEEAETPAHLMRVIDLYLTGEDRARAQLVVDYGETRLPQRELSSSKWATLRKRLQAPTAGESERVRRERIEREILGAEVTRDLAEAVRVLARSKSDLP